MPPSSSAMAHKGTGRIDRCLKYRKADTVLAPPDPFATKKVETEIFATVKPGSNNWVPMHALLMRADSEHGEIWWMWNVVLNSEATGLSHDRPVDVAVLGSEIGSSATYSARR